MNLKILNRILEGEGRLFLELQKLRLYLNWKKFYDKIRVIPKIREGVLPWQDRNSAARDSVLLII